LAFQETSLELQRGQLDLAPVRKVFHASIKNYPEYRFEKYLTADASIVHSPFFESGLVKTSRRQF
jgi:hypothetical protein